VWDLDAVSRDDDHVAALRDLDAVPCADDDHQSDHDPDHDSDADAGAGLPGR
jgi:hypothetical protein